jgi:hypothetical protein
LFIYFNKKEKKIYSSFSKILCFSSKKGTEIMKEMDREENFFVFSLSTSSKKKSIKNKKD